MEYDFLKQFSKRMKIVGMFSTLIKNSWQKTTWKQFGFETMDEQVNMIYAVLFIFTLFKLKTVKIHRMTFITQNNIYNKLSKLPAFFVRKTFFQIPVTYIINKD